MDGLQIKLFGELSIEHQGRPLPPLAGKALELFCYLLLHRDRAHTREILAEVLWPAGELATARRYLRQALWRLSTAMQYRQDNHGKETALLLSGDHGWVRINPEFSWWSDVSEFERVYATTRDVAGQSLSDRQAQELEAALGLYQGDLLATWCQDWCSYERDRLKLVYLAMLDQLTGYCEARQLYAKGLGFGQVALRYDPTRECTHRQLMRLHYRAGDRISAIRQYERCAAAMTQELGIQPSAGTVLLYEQIRADRVADIPVPPITEHPDPGRPVAEHLVAEQLVTQRLEAAALAELHLRLDQIQASLLALHRSVLQDNRVGVEHAQPRRNGSSQRTGGLLE